MGRLIDIKQAAEFLGTTERHVRNLIYRRPTQLPYLKVGNRVRFDTDDLEAYLDGTRVEPDHPTPAA